MLRNGFLILTATWLLAPTPALAQTDKGERVRFSTADEVELHGTFYPGTRRSPAVLLLHSLGPDNDSKSWRKLANHLNNQGYAVLSFDFRGHGRSRSVDLQTFNRFTVNRNLVRGNSPEIDVRDFDKRYYPVLVNDIAAAKSYLDRKNDQGECNSSNVVVIGAEEGATLGAVWMNAEWHRHRYLLSQLIGAAAQLDQNPEGVNLLCGVWLSISPQLGGRNVSLSTLLDVPGRQKKQPMIFLHSPDEPRDRAVAQALERYLKNQQALPFTAAVPVPGIGKTSGENLLSHPASLKAISDYLDNVKDAHGREWSEHETRQTIYVWRNQRGSTTQANQAGSNLLHFNTYQQFLAFR